MTLDIRLDSSFQGHRKRKKLQILLGAEGVLALVDLWIATAKNKPRGILSGMDEADIAIDARWQGEPKQLVDALVKTGWLDLDGDGTFCLHDWAHWQPWVYHSEDRSEQAKDAAKTRWEKHRKNKGLVRDAYGQHTISNAPPPNPNPSPKPRQPSAGHFEGKVRDESVLNDIVELGRFLDGKANGFNPWQFIQRSCSSHHPKAIVEVLGILKKYIENDSLKSSAWGLVNKLLPIKSQNWNERETVRAHETLKQELTTCEIPGVDLKGLFKDL